MKRTILALTAALTLLVATGCGSDTPSQEPTAANEPTVTQLAEGDTSFLEPFGLDGSDPRAVVEALDQTNEDRGSDVVGSVRYDEVVFSTPAGETTMPIEDDFYLAIAPFVEKTHECFYHNLATCQGELIGEDLDVTITTADGEVLVDETVTTYDNGFVSFWLPRDIEGTIEVAYDGKSVSAAIGTGPDDPTCVTTLRLA